MKSTVAGETTIETSAKKKRHLTNLNRTEEKKKMFYSQGQDQENADSKNYVTQKNFRKYKKPQVDPKD